MQKHLGKTLFSLWIILLYYSSLLCLWGGIIVGVVMASAETILWAFIGAVLLMIPRLFLISLNLVNCDEVMMKSFRYFVQSSGKEEEKERNAKIEIIYKRNIATWASSLRVLIDNPKWPFMDFVIGKPKEFAVSQGRHVISLNDGSLAKFARKVEIDASPEYLSRITFSSRNSFLLHRMGDVIVEYDHS